MRFATLPNGTVDGRFDILSTNNERAVPAKAAQTLQQALENWTGLAPALKDENRRLNAGEASRLSE